MRLVGQRALAQGGQLVDVFQQALMQKGFAGVAAQARDARDAQHPHQEAEVQQGLFASEAAYLVETQRMRVHGHHARAQEQHQLEQRVVDHVLDGAIGRQPVFACAQTLQAHAHR